MHYIFHVHTTHYTPHTCFLTPHTSPPHHRRHTPHSTTRHTQHTPNTRHTHTAQTRRTRTHSYDTHHTHHHTLPLYTHTTHHIPDTHHTHFTHSHATPHPPQARYIFTHPMHIPHMCAAQTTHVLHKTQPLCHKWIFLIYVPILLAFHIRARSFLKVVYLLIDICGCTGS